MNQQSEIDIQAKTPRSELGANTYPDVKLQQDGGARLRCLILKSSALWIGRHCPLAYDPSHEDNAHAQLEPKNSLSSKSTSKVLVSLVELGPSKPSQIASSTGLSQPTVQRLLKKLLVARKITKSGRTRGVRYALPKT